MFACGSVQLAAGRASLRTYMVVVPSSTMRVAIPVSLRIGTADMGVSK